MIIKVAAVQPDSRNTFENLIGRTKLLVNFALSKEADIVCLPEHWLPDLEHDMNEIIFELKKVLNNSESLVISGAGFTKDGQVLRVGAFVLDKQGILGVQYKTHLFGMEKEIAVPGNEYNLFEFKNVKFGVAICHDLVYPEVARTYALMGADILFVPSRIKRQGIAPWEIYTHARALENRLPLVVPNTFLGLDFPGKSSIIDLAVQDDIVYPRVVARAGNREDVIMAEIDVEKMKDFRLQRLKSRRPSTYSILSKDISQTL